MSDIAAYLKNEEFFINDVKLTPQELAELIDAIKDGTIIGKSGKQIVQLQYCLSYWPKVTVQGMIKEKDLVQITDPVEIEKMVMKVFSESSKQLEQYRSGRTKLQGFFAGQVMKTSKGKANHMLYLPRFSWRTLMPRSD